MYPNVPDWEWIDITSPFNYILSVLSAIWSWSGSCGFVFYESYIYWRDILVAGLMFALVCRHVLHDYDDDVEAAIEEWEPHFWADDSFD